MLHHLDIDGIAILLHDHKHYLTCNEGRELLYGYLAGILT